MDKKMYYISLDDLSVGYDKKPLISNINIGIEKGETVTLIGPNGSGKSTILKSLTKQLALVSGSVYYEERSLEKMSHAELAREVSVVLTDKVKPELLTCYDIVASGRYPHTGRLGRLSAADEGKVDEALERVNAKELGTRDFVSLSDGQKQRILIARAICQEPEIMVLDEPTSFLDIRYKLELLDILRRMAKEKSITVILSLHEIDFAREISDKIMCVKGDRIYAYGAPDAIFKDELIAELYDIKPGQYDARTGRISFESYEDREDERRMRSAGTVPIRESFEGCDDFEDRRRAMALCRRKWDSIAKPLSSLGRFEDMVVRISGIKKDHDIDISKKALVIMCADNGVVEEGVSQTGQEVTAVVAANFLKGAASSARMCKKTNTDIFPIDVGMISDVEGMERKKTAYGSENFARGMAMSREQVQLALDVGIEKVAELSKAGYGIVAVGEMGIGNTTTASAISSVLLGEPPEVMTGVGAGLSKEGLKRKISVIENAIESQKPDRNDPLDVLSKVGGFDIAAMAGVFLGGKKHDMPVVVDGFVAAVAALAATRIEPGCRDFMIPSHISNEPGTVRVLKALELEPVINAGMCLGEGTGALMLFPMLDMAVDIYENMSTFDGIGVKRYERFDEPGMKAYEKNI